MKTYTIEENRLTVKEQAEGGENRWNMDAPTALKMLDMFADMPVEIRTQLEQLAGADQVQ